MCIVWVRFIFEEDLFKVGKTLVYLIELKMIVNFEKAMQYTSDCLKLNLTTNTANEMSSEFR